VAVIDEMSLCVTQ